MSSRLLLLLLATAGLAGCAPKPAAYTDTSHCMPGGARTLCIDLRAETPTATLILEAEAPSGTQQRVLILPFAVREVQKVTNAFNIHGTFEEVTLLAYLRGPGGSRVLDMGLAPVFQSGTEGDFDRETLSGTLYYVSAGLKRRFYYNPSAAATRSSWRKLNELTPEVITTVILLLPPDADVFESHAKSARATSEVPSDRSKIKVFDHATLTGPSPQPIDVMYQVKPTLAQNVLAESLIKLFGVLLLPLMTIALLKADKVRSLRARRWFVGIVTGVEGAILTTLVWWSVHSHSTLGWSSLIDVGLVLAGATVTVWTRQIEKSDRP